MPSNRSITCSEYCYLRNAWQSHRNAIRPRLSVHVSGQRQELTARELSKLVSRCIVCFRPLRHAEITPENSKPMDICATCERQYVMDKMGVWVIVILNDTPQEIYRADLYQCPSCQHKLITDFGLPYFPAPATQEEVELVQRETYFYLRRDR